MTLEDAAKEAAGNWQHFESFVWFRDSEIDDPDNWAIIYTHNRDSGCSTRATPSHRRSDGAVHGRRRSRCGVGIP